MRWSCTQTAVCEPHRKLSVPSLSSVPCDWEGTEVCFVVRGNWREQAQRLVLRKELPCFALLFFFLVWVSQRGKVGGVAQIRFHENPPLISPVLKDLERERGWDKEAYGNEPAGVCWGPLWLSTAGPGSCRWEQNAQLYGPSSQGPQTGREETKPMSQTSLLHFNLFWFFSGGKYLGHVNN